MRLQRLMAQRGIGSRRHNEELIAAGKVTVNGRVAALGTVVGPDDVILVDGQPLPDAQRLRYVVLNKPIGVVTTRDDPGGRRTVMDLLPPDFAKLLYPVGRLDLLSEGLLLLTNDGELTNRLLHPRFEIAKVYLAWVAGQPSPEAIAVASRGIEIEPGVTARGEVSIQEKWAGGALLQVLVREGKKHEVRRICEAIGLRVKRLKRITFGPLKLGNLADGTWRELRPSEVKALRSAAGIVRGRDT